MERHELNLHIESLLSLVPEGHRGDYALRSQLIEEALSSKNWEELLQQWLTVNDMGRETALPLKIWLGFNYSSLGRVFDLSSKDLSQVLRTQRASFMPPYPPPARSQDTEEISGISCFMVEQHLSQWMDTEVVDSRIVVSMKEHFDECEACRERLSLYRELQKKILAKRKHWPSISSQEWQDSLVELTRRRRRFWQKFALYAGVLLIVIVLLLFFLVLKNEDAPNIYEWRPK